MLLLFKSWRSYDEVQIITAKGKDADTTRQEGSELDAVPSEGWLELKIEGGVVSGVINLESPGVRAPGWRPRHDKRYHEARSIVG
jgi:hypothetical protein